MFFQLAGSRRLNDSRLLEAARTHGLAGAEQARDASRTDLDWLADHALALSRLDDQGTIRLKHELDGFLQILPRLIERGPLRVRARQFFDETDVALGNLPKHGGEFDAHASIIRPKRLGPTCAAPDALGRLAPAGGFPRGGRILTPRGAGEHKR